MNEPRLVGWLTADNLFTRHEPDDLTGCKEVRVPSIDYPQVANDVQGRRYTLPKQDSALGLHNLA